MIIEVNKNRRVVKFENFFLKSNFVVNHIKSFKVNNFSKFSGKNLQYFII